MRNLAIIRELPKRRAQPEENLQAALVEHLRFRAAPGVVWYAIPNGGKRDKITAGKLKMTGTLPGVADMAFVLPGPLPAFLELKAGKRGRQSDNQKNFEAAVSALGAKYAIARTIDEATSILKTWGAIR